MKITVVGKCHREGISKKNGNPYNFNEIYYLGKSRNVVGQAPKSATLDGVEYPFDSIVVGREYNLECDSTGFVMEFTPVK